MKEYFFENGHKIKAEKLRVPHIPPDRYRNIHKEIIRPCHDVFIRYNGGILLVVRKNHPVKDVLWPIGGGVERGMKIEDSLKKKVKEECNLKLRNITEIGSARTLFETDPFGHGKGTDTINFLYLATGSGKLKLNDLHEKPIIVSRKDYTKSFRKTLHPYVRDFMDLVMLLV